MKHLLFTIALLTSAFSLQAQSVNFSYFGDTYNDLAASTSVNNGQTWDDPKFEIPIGFNFQFFQNTVDTLFISDEGLGGLAFSRPFSTDTFSVLSIFGADLIDRGYYGTASLSPISYQLSGLPGSRIFKLEWKNVGFYSELSDDNISTDYTNIQFWIYESNNDFEVRIGPTSVTQPAQCYDGETGPAIAFYPEYITSTDDFTYGGFTLVGSPNFPGIEVDTTIGDKYINGTVPEGMVYHFGSTSVATEDFIDAQFAMEIFPNPSTDLVQLKLEQANKTIKAVSITNTSGQTVKRFEGNVKEIEVRDLEAGVYFLTVRTKTQSVTKKLIKL